MVTCAVMQPYFFPYIGYYQLVMMSDIFVVMDDVAFINGGWINRNRILINGNADYITLPLIKASQNKLIHEIKICDDPKIKSKLFKTLEYNYKKAPYFDAVFALFKKVLEGSSLYISDVASQSLVLVFEYLGIVKKLVKSSEIEIEKTSVGEDRILKICKSLSASRYVNLPGGVHLYNPLHFEKQGIDLKFLSPHWQQLIYTQHTNNSSFIQGLSMLDILMNNSAEEIRFALKKCDVIHHDQIKE